MSAGCKTVADGVGVVFCCWQRCFAVPRTQVDGLACSVCDQFAYCTCDCRNQPVREYTVRLRSPDLYEFARRRRVSRFLLFAPNDAGALFERLRHQFKWDVQSEGVMLFVRFCGRATDYERAFNRAWMHFDEQQVRGCGPPESWQIGQSSTAGDP